MKIKFTPVLLLFLLWHAPARPQAATPCPVPGQNWERASASARSGWSEDKLAAAHQYADSIHTSSVMIVQDGKVVEAWGDVDKKITTFSVRKSLISALYGIYSAEGKIDINATLEQLGISDSPDPLTKAEQQARVVDLLRARSGIYHPVDFETDGQKKMRPVRGSHAPGTYWFYNNWDFNTLGSIFEKQTGQKIGDAFAQRIAQPTGMQDFQPADLFYLGGPISIHRAYLFEMTTRDMARFGQLYLCGGRWDANQIVPAAWVQKSSHAQEIVGMGNTKISGYEYLWWVETQGKLLEGGATLPGMYAAEGAGGHYILVVPSRNMVIVYQFNNQPLHKDVESTLYAAQKQGVYDDSFGHLVKLILDSQATN